MEEIRQYHDQPKLTCLLCGREYASLSAHLTCTHELEADRYREIYGLPWTTSLAGKDWREVQGRTMKKTRASGKISRMPTPEHLQVMRRSAQNRRPVVEAVRRARAPTLSEQKRQKVKTALERMEEYLRRIGTGRTITEVGKDEDMPSFQSFYKRCSENPDYLRRFEAIWDQLPVEVQIRGRRMGPRLGKMIGALLDEGKTWEEIGRIMGARAVLISLDWHRCRKSYQWKLHVSWRSDSLPLPVLVSTDTGP